MHVNTFDFFCVNVNLKTNWTFVRIVLSDGSIGWGECSLNGWEPLQTAFTDSFRALVVRQPVRDVRDIAAICKTFLHSPGGLITHSIKSAAEQALIDALARSRSCSVANLLAEAVSEHAQRASVKVYANINRATSPRTPAGFAISAQRAVALGFGSVKIAPFDGVLPSNCETQDAKRLIDDGISRIYATREAVGSSVGVKVDCHWRFTPRVAGEVLDRLSDAKLDWFECPVSEHVAFHGSIRSLRKHANSIGVKLAGAEMFTNVEGFRPFIAGGLYDVIMPDVKYCGGLVALTDIATLAAQHDVQVSPHNPTGPICNFASLHACAIAPGCDLLEYQLDESPLFRSIVGDAHPVLHEGAFIVPQSHGLGAAIDPSVIAHYPFKPVSEGLHASLG